MEHRWGHRVRTDVSVRLLAAPASAGCGHLRDISISGGYIETRLRLPLLAMLRMTVDSQQRSEDRGRTVHAIVVRREAGGLGVEWLDGSSEAVAALIDDASIPGAQLQWHATGAHPPHSF